MQEKSSKFDMVRQDDKKEVTEYNKGCNANLENRINSFEELPLFLNVNDVKKVLRLGTAKVYELFHSKDFPSKQIGRRFMISRSAFGRWMDNQEGEKDNG